MKKKTVKEPEKIDVPLDIALSLLRPDELEKLKRYIIEYYMYVKEKNNKNRRSLI
jgi:hypothetical protein